MEKQRLKSWMHFFDAIKRGDKTHDLRWKKDRSYRVGEILTLCRYDNINGVYTGEELDVEITYITDDITPCAYSSSVLGNDYCILSFKVVDKGKVTE